jgi:hypothetical protein
MLAADDTYMKNGRPQAAILFRRERSGFAG